MKLDPSGYGLIPVSQIEQHTLDNFTSGTDSLDRFLKIDAKSFQDGRIGHSTCVFHKDANGMVGYFTMSNQSIKLNQSELMDLGLNIESPIEYIPAVLIGKFAVHSDFQKVGNGKDIMELAIGEILDAPSPSAARLAVLDAVNNEKVVNFYEQCGFKHSLLAKKIATHNGRGRPLTIKMFLDILA